MLRTIFKRPQDGEWQQPMVGGRPARIPPGICIYAIGDIHGRADLMIEMHRTIMEDSQDLTPGTEKILVYVGDFVDRGLESSHVLDLLIEEPLPDFGAVYLVGNHDAWFLSFLVDAKIGQSWLRYGGDATLHSYGVRVGMVRDDLQYFERLQAELAEKVPPEHLAFLRGLEVTFQIGDYLFVHAGIRPHIPIEQQSPDDLLWIREPFLSCPDDLGVVVVHGHTVEAQPTVRNNRIGIDTGACWTGALSCVVLEEDTIRFLTTGGQPMAER